MKKTMCTLAAVAAISLAAAPAYAEQFHVITKSTDSTWNCGFGGGMFGMLNAILHGNPPFTCSDA